MTPRASSRSTKSLAVAGASGGDGADDPLSTAGWVLPCREHRVSRTVSVAAAATAARRASLPDNVRSRRTTQGIGRDPIVMNRAVVLGARVPIRADGIEQLEQGSRSLLV